MVPSLRFQAANYDLVKVASVCGESEIGDSVANLIFYTALIACGPYTPTALMSWQNTADAE